MVAVVACWPGAGGKAAPSCAGHLGTHSMAGRRPLEGPRFARAAAAVSAACRVMSHHPRWDGEGEEDQPGLREEGFILALLLEIRPRNLLQRCS